MVDSSRAVANPQLVYQVAHGSRLYGLNNAASDLDLWQVWDRLPAGLSGQRYQYGAMDIMVLEWSHFQRLADSGAPQALEAMFAPAQVIDRFQQMRAGYRADSFKATTKYLSAIRIFSESPVPKVRRHATRLTHDLALLEKHGRFNPARFARTTDSAIENYL